MRLIDADSLIKCFKENSNGDYTEWFLENIEDAIKDAPTVEREGLDKALLETDDCKWDATLKALWRRLQRHKNGADFWSESEIPEDEMYIFRAHFATALMASPLKDLETSKPNIDEMVNRFLAWKLPSDFSPDCGIEFKKHSMHPVYKFEPTGTNLFTADQAKEMIKHILAGAHVELNAPTVQREGWVSVPIEPSDEHLTSMAKRYDHGLCIDGYYDTKPIQFGASHAQRMEGTKIQMRQLYEEAIGEGFYKIPAAPKE